MGALTGMALTTTGKTCPTHVLLLAMAAAAATASEATSTLQGGDDDDDVGDDGMVGDDGVDMPADVLELIARHGGFWEWARLWRRTCKRFDLAWLLQDRDERLRITVVPDDAPTINAGIACNTDVVLVRPGVYIESVRITTDVAVLGLGSLGAATVKAPGWEPALVWGGFKAGKLSARATGGGGARVELDAASGGSGAEVRGFAFEQRNQQQQTAVYVTVGEPTISHCHVRGTVHVAGSGAAPRITHCRISGSRSCGVRFLDHSGGVVSASRVVHNQLAAVRLGTRAGSPSLRRNWYHGNGYDGVQRAGDGDEDSEDEEDAWLAYHLEIG